EDIPAYYAKHFGQDSWTAVYAMYPGDRLVNGVLETSSPYRARLENGRLDHLIAEQYPQEVSAFCATRRSDAPVNERWTSRLADHVNSQIKFHPQNSFNGLSFSVRLRDLPGRNWYNVGWTGSRFDVTNSDTPSSSSGANIETTTVVLETSIEND